MDKFESAVCCIILMAFKEFNVIIRRKHNGFQCWLRSNRKSFRHTIYTKHSNKICTYKVLEEVYNSWMVFLAFYQIFCMFCYIHYFSLFIQTSLTCNALVKFVICLMSINSVMYDKMLIKC